MYELCLCVVLIQENTVDAFVRGLALIFFYCVFIVCGGVMTSRRLLSAAIAATLALCTYQAYAYDENFKGYEVHNVSVKADAAKDEYGNTITEQSYYRTGGDVKVITREEIEKRHYRDVTEAIKRVPGVTFQNPGYRGGEYGYQFYNNGVSINGDSRVVVLVDGRRVDNIHLVV